MRPSFLGLFALGAMATFTVGCDATFTTHLRVNVKRTVSAATPRSAAGAWVVPIASPQAAVRIDEGGQAATDHGGFLKNTSHSAVLVVLPGYRPLVAMPWRDFALRPRHWFYNTEWDAELSATLVPLPEGPGLPLECDAGRCHMRIPCSYFDYCHPSLVAIGPSKVRVIEPPGPPREAGNGAWDVQLMLPADLDLPADLIGVATFSAMNGESSSAVVTDTVHLAR